MRFLSVLSKRLFRDHEGRVVTRGTIRGDSISRLTVRCRLRHDQTVARVLRVVSSSGDFRGITRSVLQRAYRDLRVSNKYLLHRGAKRGATSVVYRCAGRPSGSVLTRKRRVPVNTLPFCGNGPCVVSSSSVVPRPFTRLFGAYRVDTKVFRPVRVRGHATVCFYICSGRGAEV